jgi:hypothetical protein
MKANSALALRGTSSQTMRFAAIHPIALSDALAHRQMDAAMRTGHHFFRGWILPRRGIGPPCRLALRPYPPDRRQESKQKQVFHHLPRKQKKLTENPQASIFTTFRYFARHTEDVNAFTRRTKQENWWVTKTDSRKQKATPKDG